MLKKFLRQLMKKEQMEIITQMEQILLEEKVIKLNSKNQKI